MTDIRNVAEVLAEKLAMPYDELEASDLEREEVRDQLFELALWFIRRNPSWADDLTPAIVADAMSHVERLFHVEQPDALTSETRLAAALYVAQDALDEALQVITLTEETPDE